MRTTIRASCIDQKLKVVTSPMLASGGMNEAEVAFDFCEKWDGFAKTGVFYRDEDNVYYSLLNDNDVCIVPHEVYDDPGTFYFTVFGDRDSVRRTASTVRYKAHKGIVGDAMMPSDPTPDVYDQIMASVADMNEKADSGALAGPKGDPGYTPIKGIDYFDGEKGDPGYTPVKGVDYFDGEKGDSGYTPIKGVDYFDGKNGVDGKDGNDGYTPIKGVDYFDGKDGKDGKDGQDGVNGKDGTNGKDGKDGTSVTITNISESNADGGSNVVTFSDGKTLTVKNGSKGSDGEGGGGGVSDWNDLTNRPFYDNEDGSVGKQLDDKYLKMLEIGESRTDIIPEQELTFTLDESYGIYSLFGDSLFNMLALTVGEKYTVVWGSDAFECTAIESTFSGVPCIGIGNAKLNTGVDTGEPFVFFRLVAEGTESHNLCILAALDNSTTKMVSVYQTEEGYKIKPSYLPDSLYTQIDKRIEDYINEALGGDY